METGDGGLSPFRTDTTEKAHFIKAFGKKFLPHTHHFTWKLIEGIWRYVETVLPF